MDRSISIVVPVYNEGVLVWRSIRRLIAALKIHKYRRYEIILIENGSRDDSLKYCQQLSQQYPKQVMTSQLDYPSYGQAIKTGILMAKNELIVIFNVDYWDVNFLTEALTLMPPAEIVVGSKTLVTSRDERPAIRKLTTYFFNSLIRLIFNFQGTDTHGIKVIDRDLAVRLVKKCRALNELLDTELILRACREKRRYFELPVKVHEVRPSRYNNWRRAYNTSIDMLTVFKTKIYDLSHQRR